ncbi:MAG: T9SS type A sorting domain-containing protein [Bacteroidales bacterium]|jgi:phage baseplate assembly protein gpV|nr:T9SS type A sorting domain-containing protein [Bacteroidales bacterium]
MKKYWMTGLCLILALCGVAQKKYYVKTDGSPSLSGSSWTWASNNLQATIERASSGDVVYVAAGTYYGGFTMKEGVTVKGGYTANNSVPEERYPVGETGDLSKLSILDGGQTQRVVTQLTPFSTPTVWEGFVLQNGNPSPEFKQGSIIYSFDGDNRIVGVLYKYNPGTGDGMMISAAETQKQWGGYESEISALPVIPDRESAKTDVTGQTRAEAILAAVGAECVDISGLDVVRNGNYAAFWCDTLAAGGFTDWHLPSAGEWGEISSANIKSILKNLGKNLDYPFWTSSHAGNMLAWAYCFGSGDGYFHPALKYVQYPVEAVCPVSLPEAPDGIYVAGGGAFLAANGQLDKCVVKNNSSTSMGGGVYVGNGAALVDCVVEENEAPDGKDIYYENPSHVPSVNGNRTISIYPNPVAAGEMLNLDWYDGGQYQWISIAAGITVKKGRLLSPSLQAPMTAGAYLLRILSANGNYQTKVIVY